MKDYLTELEISKVEQFCSDKEMFEAVKKVALQYVYTHGSIQKGKKHHALNNRALTFVEDGADDATVGQRLRALYEGVQAVEKAFYDLENIKSTKPEQVEAPANEAI